MDNHKGYPVSSGYRGYIGNGEYRLFSDEGEYDEYYDENKESIDNDSIEESVDVVKDMINESKKMSVITDDEATYLLGGFITKNEMNGITIHLTFKGS